jgi:hypothetical protein
MRLLGENIVTMGVFSFRKSLDIMSRLMWSKSQALCGLMIDATVWQVFEAPGGF